MTGKTKKQSSDRIFVRGSGGAPQRKAAKHDDIALLALQLACPQRWEPGETQLFDDIHEILNLYAITIETRLFSSLIVIGTNNTRKHVSTLIGPLTAQIQNIIKSAQEKIYFIEAFELTDPKILDWDFFVKMSDYCFMQESAGVGATFAGYFRLEKTSDEDRFASRSMESMENDEAVEQDVYLFFAKNNRYVKILKKGETLEKRRRDRLKSRGVTDLFYTSDQSLEMQQRRVRHLLFELLEDYATLLNAA